MIWIYDLNLIATFTATKAERAQFFSHYFNSLFNHLSPQAIRDKVNKYGTYWLSNLGKKRPRTKIIAFHAHSIGPKSD